MSENTQCDSGRINLIIEHQNIVPSRTNGEGRVLASSDCASTRLGDFEAARGV